MIRYTSVSGGAWVCHRPEGLLADFEVGEEQIKNFHAIVEAYERPWRFARLFYGIQPMIPPENYPLEFLEVFTAEQVAAHLGIKRSAVAEEIAAIQGIWRSVLSRKHDRAEEAARAEAGKRAAEAEVFGDEDQGALPLGKTDLLEKYGFGRLKFHSTEEQSWFLSRVEDLRKALDDTMARDLARRVLQNDLMRRRYADLLTALTEEMLLGGVDRPLLRAFQELDDTYIKLLKELDEIAPWKGLVGGKVTLRGSLSDLIRAMQFARGRQDFRMTKALAEVGEIEVVADRGVEELLGRRLLSPAGELVDGVFTADEIEALMRTCVEAPSPQYEPGVVLMINEAKARLWDPDFRPAMSPEVLGRLRRAWMAAEAEARKESGAPEISLLGDGPEDEYPDLALVAIEEAERAAALESKAAGKPGKRGDGAPSNQ